MTILNIQQLESIFSKSRLLPYSENSIDPKLILHKYNANIALSVAILPALHYIEICLRNRLNQVICKHFGSNWLLQLPKTLLISEQDEQKINQIIQKIGKHTKREITHDDVVAQMTFGFWCSFFHRKYDPVLWQLNGAFKTTFPNVSRKNRKRSYLEKEILDIKNIRNRIAHHEPIWNNNISVNDYYNMSIRFLSMMSKEALAALQLIDKFLETYNQMHKLLFIS